MTCRRADAVNCHGAQWIWLEDRTPSPYWSGDQFGDQLKWPIPEKSIGATGFEPAT